MAQITLNDLTNAFNSVTWRAVLQGEFLKTLAFFGSGFLADASNMIDMSPKGTHGNMPQWTVDLTDPTAIAYNSTLTPGAQSAPYVDRFAWMELEKAWSAQELINTVAGNDYDSIDEVARHIGQYWAYQLQKRAINVLKGTFATALASTHSTGSDYAAANITNSGVLAARQKLGDFKKMLSIMLMNSAVYTDAVAGNLVTPATDMQPGEQAAYEAYRTGSPGRIFGMQPYEDDDIEAVSSVLSTYMGGPRSMVYGLRPRNKAPLSGAIYASTSNNIDIELVRDALTAGGVNTLITRISAMVHLPGVQFSSAVVNPSTTDLATGSNWTKVAPTKAIKVVELKTKATGVS